MLLLAPVAALLASAGWATGIVLAQRPARALGAFEFTRVQLVSCFGILAVICTVLGLWQSVDWGFWPAFVVSTAIGIFAGNLAMIACLRRGGPRRTELMLALKAPIIGAMAFVWLGEIPHLSDLLGAAVALAGIALAILFGTDARSKRDTLEGSLLVVIMLGLLATGCMALGFLVLKPALQAGLDPLAASAVRLGGAALIISVIGLWPSAIFRSEAEMTPSLLAQTILPGFIGYVLSSSLLLFALAHFDAGIATVLASLSPILVIAIVGLRDRLIPPWPAIVGAALAVLGSAIIVLA
ncbi:EamA family transporter [Pontivivens insulae]|uniref:EamA domain-containing protein n=1 Tax=Pontivivens insulae TaxID=1639689 RepID=A0A2R8AE14_9RHOB|nr:EamA family transporter [Pontivivens insulae]RED14225.1 EamA-like transporter family protein [Pontivivens insulae]SPF30300.1 hypothetical protein POI8812_02636 [Pontivivens insulae]